MSRRRHSNKWPQWFTFGPHYNRHPGRNSHTTTGTLGETCYSARPPPPGPDTTTGTLGGIHTLQSTLETLALHYKQLKFRSEPPGPVGTQAIRSVRARVRLKSYFRAAPGASGYQNTYYQCKDMSGDGQIFKCKFSSLRSGSTAQSHHCGATPQSRHFDSFSTQSMSDTVWM